MIWSLLLTLAHATAWDQGLPRPEVLSPDACARYLITEVHPSEAEAELADEMIQWLRRVHPEYFELTGAAGSEEELYRLFFAAHGYALPPYAPKLAWRRPLRRHHARAGQALATTSLPRPLFTADFLWQSVAYLNDPSLQLTNEGGHCPTPGLRLSQSLLRSPAACALVYRYLYHHLEDLLREDLALQKAIHHEGVADAVRLALIDWQRNAEPFDVVGLLSERERTAWDANRTPAAWLFADLAEVKTLLASTLDPAPAAIMRDLLRAVELIGSLLEHLNDHAHPPLPFARWYADRRDIRRYVNPLVQETSELTLERMNEVETLGQASDVLARLDAWVTERNRALASAAPDAATLAPAARVLLKAKLETAAQASEATVHAREAVLARSEQLARELAELSKLRELAIDAQIMGLIPIRERARLVRHLARYRSIETGEALTW